MNNTCKPFKIEFNEAPSGQRWTCVEAFSHEAEEAAEFLARWLVKDQKAVVHLINFSEDVRDTTEDVSVDVLIDADTREMFWNGCSWCVSADPSC